jgi:hypothetical protein
MFVVIPHTHYKVNATWQMMGDLRERYFGPSFELFSHDKVTHLWSLF